ncbi:hypothetical protein DCAR_0313642 [Daucus carota subsp. sativus]|uniref:DC1 domain-containing protein n=2 Tax=Daucus carota subsp. sativus TaxID=79200 RepID=A0A169WE76_DAUCS|nr:PREDICTED: uncharacterized protein LOC108213956 [Daucus carota subsp. sativus]WOG94349.1 hypothetical protein DCAR_0313642 [Daucus carota subsp. sativus]
MATIKHDRHEHELNLIKGVDVNMAGKGACGVCEMPLIGASDQIYTCLEKNCHINFFFLHKKCVELPTRITHLNHPQHPLTLGHHLITQELLSYVSPDAPLCDICLRGIDEAMSVYYCEVCSEVVSVSSTKSLSLFAYLLCISCATVESVLDHPGHEAHILTLVPRLIYSRCDACGLQQYDMCYTCLECQFWIHVSCAVSPPTIKLRFHEDDTLHLVYSVPPMYRSFLKRCSICKNPVLEEYWAYFCEDSGYFVHIRCATRLLA